jgi:hypothetical protein
MRFSRGGLVVSIGLKWAQIQLINGKSKMMGKQYFAANTHKLAALGFLLTIPALIIFIPGILQTGLGLTRLNDGLDALLTQFNVLKLIIHPIVVLGGLFLALSLNVMPVIQTKFQLNDGNLMSVITIKGKLLNLGMMALVLFLTAALLLYAFVENFQIVAR